MANDSKSAEDEISSPWKTLLPFRRIPEQFKDEIPIHRVGLISFLVYGWLDVVMWKMFRRKQYDPVDRWRCPTVDEASRNADRLEQLWREELNVSGRDKASMQRVFVKFIRERCTAAVVTLIISSALLLFAVAYVLMYILSLTAANNDSDALWKGLLLVAGLFVCYVLSALTFICSSTLGHIAAGRLRAGILCLLYRKLLQASSLPDETVGKIINLYANDGQRIFDGASLMPNIVIGPILAIGATIYAIYLIGAWALIGLAILLLIMPMQMTVGKAFMSFRQKAIVITDKRVRMMNEYLANIRFIKMYSWEKPLSKLLAVVRAAEQKILERVNVSLSLAFLSSGILVSVSTVVTLIIYTSCGNRLTGVEGFMYLLIYSSIQDKLEFCMISIKMISELFVAAKRFQDVFISDEMNMVAGNVRYRHMEQGTKAVEATGAMFEWPYQRVCGGKEKEEKQDAPGKKSENIYTAAKMNNLKDSENNELTSMMKPERSENESQQLNPVYFNFKLDKGNLVGIAGPVSSGKTALIKALLGQMNVVSGEVVVTGSIAYVPQQPWIYGATVRDNILFGCPFDSDRYNSVVEACCLRADLSLLADGDQTVIGERGTTLSGGQKQRISLCRAIYSDRQVYLLDDPLAAVDPDVATSIFNDVVLGMLAGKTVILVTHQLKFLSKCDYIIYLPGAGCMPECGTHEQLMAETNGEFASVVTNVLTQQQQQARQSQLQRTTDTDYSTGDELDDDMDATMAILSSSRTQLSQQQRQPASVGRGGGDADSTDGKSPDDIEIQTIPLKSGEPVDPEASHTVVKKNQQALPDERQGAGAVSWQTYAAYISCAGGPLAVVGVLLASIIAEGSRAFSYWWLAYWLDQGSGNTTVLVGNTTVISESITDNPQLSMYQLVYGLSLLAIILFFISRSILLIKVLMRSSSQLHDRLFVKVMRAPVLFFDITPLGRIVNRFSRDMDEMDSRLPMMIDNTLRSLLNIVIYMALIAAIMPWFLLALPVVGVIFVLFYAMFRAGIRRLQRLQLASMAPLLSHIDASVRGLASIRSYNRTEEFERRFGHLLDENTCCLLLCHYASRWVNVRLSFITSLLVCVTALLVVLLRDIVPTSYAGAAIIYSFQLLTLFQFFVRFAVDTEATFTSTERIHGYIRKLPEEGPFITQSSGVLSQWPTNGQIEFTDFRLRYRDTLPVVLDGVSFQIRSSEKIGIVGRTGAGKSSLVSALFRLTEKTGGRINIDNIDISVVGLELLRSKLSIIPQDPVLFSGTIRSNLDPFDYHTDRELWNALEKCHVKDVVSGLDGQLLGQVVENGDNFSAGERQLLCLARVLLRHTRIVILDEATASLDAETAQRIHDTIRETFSDCTLLIIAHSMSTVLECDRILVIDSGKVVEFDSPSALLSNPDSRFSQLVASSDASKGDGKLTDKFTLSNLL